MKIANTKYYPRLNSMDILFDCDTCHYRIEYYFTRKPELQYITKICGPTRIVAFLFDTPDGHPRELPGKAFYFEDYDLIGT